ncbi:MAG: hypothetical protein QXS93_04655 [Candidatus Micrarchaeia archaeon]
MKSFQKLSAEKLTSFFVLAVILLIGIIALSRLINVLPDNETTKELKESYKTNTDFFARLIPNDLPILILEVLFVFLIVLKMYTLLSSRRNTR